MLRLGIASALLSGCMTGPDRTIMMAAEVGARAPDAVGDQPGNPFATAFIALLAEPGLPLGAFGAELRNRTRQISGGLLSPDIGRLTGDASVRLGDPRSGARRIALVVIHARYTDGLPALDGAVHDAGRVGEALTQAGFQTEVLLDPNRTEREAALRRLETSSAGADVAILYSTGHGVMHDGEGYLLDSDFLLGWREEALAAHALRIADLGTGLRAAKANLVLFGGCRTYEWWG